MLKNTDKNESKEQLSSLVPSTWRTTRNWLFSTLVPVNLAMNIANRLGNPSEKGVFKEFITELQEGLYFKGDSSDLIGKLISRYFQELLCRKMHTGELAEFRDQLEFDLKQAYDLTLDDSTRQLYKQRAFQRVMSKMGAHGTKFIQNLRPKEANSWIAKVIATAQTDLPVPTIEEFEGMLKEAFKQQGTLDYVKHFSDLCKVHKFYGAGTIGIVALVEFKSLASPYRIVKMLRPGGLENFLIDHECFTKAIEGLAAEHSITEQEARTLMEFNNRLTNNELKEFSTTLETANLAKSPYYEQGLFETVRCDLELTAKARDVVIMDVASGQALGKYLQGLSLALANATNEQERASVLAQFAEVRSLYAKLALLHFYIEASNQSIHGDLHAGNVFYDQSKMKIIDLGSMEQPREPAEHLKLHRFLFALNLSLATADIHFLRLYYQNEAQVNPTITMEQIEPMLEQLQATLNNIRIESVDSNVIDVDRALDDVLENIKDAVLTVGSHIVPAALFPIAKANVPVNDTLDSLKHIIGNSSIPYGERTQFILSLRAAYKARESQKDLWTQETWDYFWSSILSPKDPFAQLQFGKKFIYGILGLDKDEAQHADWMLLIAGAVLSASVLAAPFVAYLGAHFLKDKVNTASERFSQMMASYHLMQRLSGMYQAGKMSSEESFRQVKELLQRYKPNMSWGRGQKIAPLRAVPTPITGANQPAAYMKFTKQFSRFSPRFFIGVAVGAAAVEGLHWLKDRDRKIEP